MTTTLTKRERNAHRAAVQMDIAAMTAFLQEVLGAKLVAYIAGRDDHRQVGGWAKGDHHPRDDAEERLRFAYQVFHLLQSQESPHTVRAWFIGLNPQLADESPASTIRDGNYKDVLVAARAFLAGG